ncbi:MAG TPA: hypothetical protein VF139_19670 [Candidatus Polarisedimenticolaceae bacterium]
MLKQVLTALSLLAFAPAASALPPDADRWHERSTPNFRVLSNAPEPASLALAMRLERLRHALGLLTPGVPLRTTRPIDVVLFRDAASFRPYCRLYATTNPSRPSAFYRSAEYRDVIALPVAGPDEIPVDVATSAYLSDLLESAFPRGPRWLREGLAQIYANARVEGDLVEVGRPIGAHLRALGREQPIPVADLLRAVRPIGPEPKILGDSSIFQAESWALAAFLLVERGELRAPTTEFVRRVAKGEDPVAAWTATVAIEPSQLDADLAAFARNERFAFYRIPATPPAFDASARPIARPELLTRLGWLLASLDPVNASESEAHFRAALAERPGFAPALAGIGWLRSRERKYDAAAPAFEEALAAAPADALVATIAARNLLSRAGSRPAGVEADATAAVDVARARALLERVLEGDPDDAEALASLGATYVAGPGDPAIGIAAIEKALPRLPPRADVLLNLVSLRARAGDRAGAQAVLDGPIAALDDPSVVATGRERMALADFPGINARIASGDLEGALALLRSGRDAAPSADIRSRFDAEIARIEPVARRNRHAAQFNDAAGLANRGDWTAAGALCEAILADTPDDEIRARAEDLLARSRRAAPPRKR